MLRPSERVDDLQYHGLKIIQNSGAFCFGMDAVLLADFTRVKPRDRIADMGSGTGILPLLLSQKDERACFEAIELQPEMAEMAERTMVLNRLDDRIHVHQMDMRAAAETFGPESMTAVVCNPPYGKRGSVLPSERATVLLSRHETDMTISDIVLCCAAILCNHGRLSMVFPAQRLLELCDALRACRMEPKRLRAVCAKASKPPYLMLVEAVKNAKPALLWLPPLIVYREDGTETTELRRIYHQEPLTP